MSIISNSVIAESVISLSIVSTSLLPSVQVCSRRIIASCHGMTGRAGRNEAMAMGPWRTNVFAQCSVLTHRQCAPSRRRSGTPSTPPPSP